MRSTLLTLSLLGLLACSAGNSDEGTSSGSAGTSSGGADSGTGSAQTTGDFTTGSGGGTIEAVGTLTGKVVAPEGTIPISGALVYLTAVPPPAIPDGVFCDTCVKINSDVAHGFTKADGTFEIPTYVEGNQYLVVQKGQFRRVRPISVVKGPMQADPTATRLPSRMDKANGDDIPKMAIQEGQWDEIGTTLVQLGIDQDQIATYGCQGFSCESPFDSYAELSKYHIAFAPCGSCNGGTGSQNDAIRQFVEGGGKFYVTDWSYQWMTDAFPGYVDFELISANDDACTISEYDAAATMLDPELAAWLGAQGISNPVFEKGYTRIKSLNSVNTTDLNGQPTTITPKTWVRGQTPNGDRPLTVSFEQQCGRVLFSTYHSESSGGLLPQELALLYVILEVGVCVEVPVPQ